MSINQKDSVSDDFKDHTSEDRKLMKRKQLANWWYYHKWHVLIAFVLLCSLASIMKSALHIGEVEPDFRIAYVGTNAIPEDTAAELITRFESIGEDFNKDGRVCVELNQYASNENAGEESTYYKYAAEVLLLADLDDCDSFFFLLEDPEGFERDYGALAYLDGSLPKEDAKDYEHMYISWSESPVLRTWEFGTYNTDTLGMEATGDSNELLGKLFLARRGFWTEKTCSNLEGCERLWMDIQGITGGE